MFLSLMSIHNVHWRFESASFTGLWRPRMTTDGKIHHVLAG